MVERKTGPLLASEALREELAPATPWARSARAWAAAAAAVCIAAATVQLLTAGPNASLAVSIVVIASLIAAAALPLPYPRRAFWLLSTGITGAAAGAFGAGPAAVPASVPAALAHAVAATTVGGALLFRSRYRAYAPARRFLGLALVSALPLLGWCAYLVLRGSFAVQLTATVMIIALLASLLGFMGKETDIGESIAATVIAAVVLELGSESLSARWPDPAWLLGPHLVGPLAFGGLAAVAALGLAQWLAHRSWRDARAVALAPPAEGAAPFEEDTWGG